MTESGESCSSSNYDSENSTYSEPKEEDTFHIAPGYFDDFNIEKFVQEQIDSAVREASRICATPKSDSAKLVSPLRGFTHWCRTKCRFNLMKTISIASLFWSLIHLALFFLRTSQIMREPPPPVPFFRPLNGTVQDFYDGNGAMPDLLMSKAEFVIVMLYAPWDSRSKQFRSSFVDVANAFIGIDSVKFVASNCYYHRGQCKRMYKIHSFPVIFALSPYPNGHPILYNQILSADRLFSWVLHLLNPLQKLHSVDELRNAVLLSDFLVVAHFAFEGPSLPRSYHVFLNTAYKLADLRSSVAFAIVLNGSLALDDLEFDNANQINLYTFYEDNTSHGRIASIGIDRDNVKSQEVANWVKEQIHSKFDTKAIYDLELDDLETAGKSEALFRRMSLFPATLVLFTNSLGLRCHSQSQIALRNFVKLFHHCPSYLENLELRAMSDTFFRAPSHEHLFGKSRKICALRTEQLDFCCHQFSMKGKCGKSIVEHSSKIGEDNRNDSGNGCEEMFSLLSEGHQFSRFCCARRKGNDGTIFEQFAHLNWYQRLMCKFDQLIRVRQPDLHQQLHSDTTTIDETDEGFGELFPPQRWLIGAGCRMNKSLGFLTVDKRFGRHFMHKWGISTNKIGLDFVAIVARADERIFVMENATKTVTISHLADFVHGFYKNTLKWRPKNQKIAETIVEEEAQENEDKQRQHFLGSSILERINRSAFLGRILNAQNRSFDAVVFFSGGDSHIHSQSVLHFFHYAQNYFEGFGELIKFYITDSSQNSFEWHFFRFRRLPTVAFFPAKSRQNFVLRADIAFTVPNLLGFILPRCQPKLRWRLAFAICKGKCLERNLRTIGQMVAKAREEIRILRGMIRKLRFKRGDVAGLSHYDGTFSSVHNFQKYLKRRKLQKAMLLRLSEFVSELTQRQMDERTDDSKVRQMATEAIFSNWLLTTNAASTANDLRR